MKSVKIKKVDQKISGTLSFPGDKSLSHRAIIFGSIAEGVSSFTNVLAGEDCAYTHKAFETMGVKIESKSPTEISITGRGLHSLQDPKKELYLGNSGTSMRLLLGLLAGAGIEATLTGDASLSSRPMRRVTDFLKQMGASFEGGDGADFAPIMVRGGKLKGIDAKLPVSSAQVKSAILLAALYADGKTSVTEPEKSRDHTERFLEYFGVKIEKCRGEAAPRPYTVSIEGGQNLKAKSFAIAGDISSAAFFIVMALLLPEPVIQFRKILCNPTRTGILEVLKRMGVEFSEWMPREGGLAGPEPIVDFWLRGKPKALKNFEIKKEELPSLIDELPILMVLATQVQGTSIIHDAGELRVKETDRIHSMATGLRRMGAQIRVEGNTLYIDGPKTLSGNEIDSFKDHRTATSLIVAGMIAEGQTVVRDVECIKTSFPGFFGFLDRLGVHYETC